MIPNAKVTKLDGQTGVVTPGARGICAIIAPCSAGVANQPAGYAKAGLALTDFNYGILTDAAAYVMAEAGKSVVLVKGTASTAGTSGAVVFTGTGTSVATQTGVPIDDFAVLVKIVAGGTRGVDGITYTESLDGGVTVSAVKALGLATSITIPNSGVIVSLAAGTLVAGDTIAVPTTGPRMSTADVSTALEALRLSALPWEMVMVLGHDATATTVTILDTWLSTREAEGRFRGFLCNARPRSTGETEAAYLTAMTTAFGASASIRGCVGADGGDLPSALAGRAIVQKRPTALALGARLMGINYGVDAAYVSDGPVAGFALADARGNPNHHDEYLYPGLDAQRLVTLRTFDRKAGTFITNANTIASSGSDYVWAQHIRTMNRACEIAYDVLTGQLSRGVGSNPKHGPTGQVYIAEEDAQRIEALVNQSLNELRGQVTDLRYVLSRTDDIGANGPVTLTGQVLVDSLAYVKEFATNASFTRSLSVQQ